MNSSHPSRTQTYDHGWLTLGRYILLGEEGTSEAEELQET